VLEGAGEEEGLAAGLVEDDRETEAIAVLVVEGVFEEDDEGDEAREGESEGTGELLGVRVAVAVEVAVAVAVAVAVDVAVLVGALAAGQLGSQVKPVPRTVIVTERSPSCPLVEERTTKKVCP